MGAWPFASTFIEEVADDIGCEHPRPRYAGRPSAASPATGLHSRHVAEQRALLDEAFEVGKEAMSRIAARKVIPDQGITIPGNPGTEATGKQPPRHSPNSCPDH